MRGTVMLRPLRLSDFAGMIEVDAFERGGEAIGIALPPHLAVGQDIDAGALLVADRQECRVVLRLLEPLRRDPPQSLRAHPRRHLVPELLAIDQPVRLRVRTDQSHGEQLRRPRHFQRPHHCAPNALPPPLPGTTPVCGGWACNESGNITAA